MRWLLALVVALAACSGKGGNGSPDAGANDGSAATGVPAPGLPVVKSLGGPVLAAPKAVVVTFAGDPNAAALEALVAKIGATEHWRAVTAEYGVGALTARAPVRLSDPAPGAIDDASIQKLLAAKLDAARELGEPDTGTIYVLVFPAATQITSPLGASCKDFGGYHSEAEVRGVPVPYAVVPTCAKYFQLTGIDELSMSIAHELVEAATDPYSITRKAFDGVDALHAAWPLALGGYELVDLCAQNQDAVYTPAGFDFMVPRSWSNAAATAGHDPCVPGAGGAYFNTLPEAPDTLAVTVMGVTQSAQGIRIALGASRAVTLAAFSDRPPPLAGTWSLALEDESSWRGGPKELSFSLEKAEASAGEVVRVTITALSHGPLGVEPFLVRSTANGRTTLAAGLVGD